MSKTTKTIYLILFIVFCVIVIQILVADKHRAVLVVKEIEEDGEKRIGVNPTTDRLDFGDLPRDTGATRYISINNRGNYKIYIMVWKFGAISELIKLSRNNFTLGPGEKERLALELYLPVSANKQRYAGWVWVFKLPRW